MTQLNDHELALKSWQYRRDILRAIKHAGAGHTGGSLSCTDILNVLYNRTLNVSPDTFGSPTRDRYVQSKGHSVEALFVVLADQGFFPASDLDTLCGYQSHFVGHPTRKVPGIEQNTGALGHGLPICTGMAIGAKLDEADWHVFTLLGDGELAEGSNWEAAMAAAHYRLDNLTAIIDCNSLQITGRTRDVMSSEPLANKFDAFGWAVREVDGHDLAALEDALARPLAAGKPSAIIARTIKGKGVSFMEDVGRWHHGVPNDEEFAAAIEEIDAAMARLEAAA
ncbi:transketolase [Marinihelvus fidelis]|uniref:transketolase n=1 Tax=Marinihelvus fidelis TaxID=2613842 RepID=UPI001CD69513|nr:transketolase [Marinihelvus fidelis]